MLHTGPYREGGTWGTCAPPPLGLGDDLFFAFQPILVVFLGNLGALVSILGGGTFNFGPYLRALFQFGGAKPPVRFRENTALSVVRRFRHQHELSRCSCL